MRAGAVGEEAHAPQEVAVRDAGRGDDHLARGELVGLEDLVEVVDPVLLRLLDLVARGRPELRLELAAEAAEGGRGEHGLARAADADREVVVRAAHGGRDRRGHVAVLDQLDAGAGGPDLLDQVVVARAVEDDRGDVAGPPAVGVGDRGDVLADRLPQVDAPAGDGPTAILRMYICGRRGKEPDSPDGDHGHRAVVAARDDRPALERVDGEVDLGPAAPDRARRWRARRPPRRRRRPRGR